MNVVFLALAWTTIAAPIFEFSPVGQTAFQSVIGASTGIVVGSMVAYLVSQYVFKLGVALVDTPFVYAFVSVVRSGAASDSRDTTGD